MRIFDNPGHKHYGPIRRLWVIMVQLDLLEAAETWGNRNKMTWDGAVSSLYDENPHVAENVYQRWFLRALL